MQKNTVIFFIGFSFLIVLSTANATLSDLSFSLVHESSFSSKRKKQSSTSGEETPLAEIIRLKEAQTPLMRKVLPYAKIAYCAYGNRHQQARIQLSSGDHFQNVPESNLPATLQGFYNPITRCIEDLSTGMRMRIFTSDTTDQVIIAFAGTPKNIRSRRLLTTMTANVTNFAGIPSKLYKQATEWANTLVYHYGSNTVLTGHSLGGALAQKACLECDDDSAVFAITFNAPGIRGLNLKAIFRSNDDNPQQTELRAQASILSFYTQGESISQKHPGKKFGKVIVIPSNKGRGMHHGIKEVLARLEDAISSEEES